MVRTLMCLPLCLLLSPSYPGATQPLDSRPPQRVKQDDSAANGFLHSQEDVIAFLEACLKRYEENVQSYTLIFRKRERIGGINHPWETIEVFYRENPHAVFFDWQEGARLATKAMYAEGEYKSDKGKGKSQIVAMPKAKFLGIQYSKTDSGSSKSSGRYPLNEFGLKQAVQRVLEAWKAAADEKTLTVEYLGLYKIPEIGEQTCYKIRRHSFARPEGADGVSEVVLYIDCKTLFQVGSIVYGQRGEVLGEYYFRNIRLNAKIADEQFTEEALKK